MWMMSASIQPHRWGWPELRDLGAVVIKSAQTAEVPNVALDLYLYGPALSRACLRMHELR